VVMTELALVKVDVAVAVIYIVVNCVFEGGGFPPTVTYVVYVEVVSG
jgi:hypothetical protein